MKSQLSPGRLLLFIVLLLAAVIETLPAADSATQKKPVFLYSRHYNAGGENRYLPDGNFKELLTRLRGEFDVRVHDQALDAQTLVDVSVVLIANPSDRAAGTNAPPPHMSAADIAALTRYVEQGGGLIVMGNQENHNLEIEDVNKLLLHFGLQFTNLYTDVKKLALPKETPIIGGLRWGYYTGNLVLITPDHPARPRPLVVNDRAQKPLAGTRNASGTLLAVAEPGRGHVVIVTDCGWLTEDALTEKGIGGVAVKGQDNWEIFRRLSHWAATPTAGRDN